jgi:hypothetical protein
MNVWVLIIDHREGRTVTVHTTQALAERALNDWCDEWWESELGKMTRPADGDLIAAYFDMVQDESADIEICKIFAPSETPAPPRPDRQLLKLNIPEAKEALARNYDVSPDAIDIIIRG